MLLLILQAVDISRVDYEPSDTDILYADGINFSNAVACTDFHFPQPSAGSSNDEHDQQQTSWRLVNAICSAYLDNARCYRSLRLVLQFLI